MNKSLEFGLAFAAAIGILSGTGSSALAQEATPDATAAPAMFASVVAAGLSDPKGKVPALDAVTGAGVHTLSISQPLVILTHGTAYTYVVVSQDNTFKGTCTSYYSIVRGTAVLVSEKIKSYACKPNTFWDWGIKGKLVPNKPGLATLVGTVLYGGKKVTTSTTVLIE